MNLSEAFGMVEFTEFTFALVFLQILVVFSTLAKALALKNFFSLNSVVSLALLFYVALPILICLPHAQVVVNGAVIPVVPEALFLASSFGLLWSMMLHCMPSLDTSRIKAEGWIVWLFGVLFVVNLANLIMFVRNFDLAVALMSLSSGAGANYRDLAFQGLKETDTGYGYVPKILHLAVFGCLWISRGMPKKWLIAGVSPVILLDVISFGRHTLASFFVLLFFCLERNGAGRRIYWVAPILVFVLFFSRVFIFSFTDVSYGDWLGSSFDAKGGGVEFLGEFFNTFGTYLMVAAAPANSFDLHEVLAMFVGQALLPPGFGQDFYSVIGIDFPLFRVSDMMHSRYGPHPAHHAFVDVYTFGAFLIVGLLIYVAGAIWASRGRSSLALVSYLFLLGIFYLPFRGSLTLNALRLIWLLVGLWAFSMLFRSVPVLKFKV